MPRKLKDFARINLEPGQTKTVELGLTPDKLKFYDINMDYRVEAGQFTVMLGNSSAEENLQEIRFVVMEPEK